MELYCCPLCKSLRTTLVLKQRRREYYFCECCSLTFVPDKFHLSREKEFERYNRHENSAEDERYVKFLKTLTEPLLKIAPEGKSWKGLDFGAGSTETLSLLMGERGHKFYSYDPFLDKKKSCWKINTMLLRSEVIEHFQPRT